MESSLVIRHQEAARTSLLAGGMCKSTPRGRFWDSLEGTGHFRLADTGIRTLYRRRLSLFTRAAELGQPARLSDRYYGGDAISYPSADLLGATP